MNAAELIAFEDDMTELFAQGQIKAPLHLSGGNEQQLIDIFKEIDKEHDWVLGSWRSHYHALLKGVPPEKVKKAILDGHSISLAFPEHRFLCSGIVGGIAPIAVGIAAGLKRDGVCFDSKAKDGWIPVPKVWCFIGDMTSVSGIVHESVRYAYGHDLNIEFVVENNGLSVCTDTQKAWGEKLSKKWRLYEYKLTKAHVGIGRHVRF